MVASLGAAAKSRSTSPDPLLTSTVPDRSSVPWTMPEPVRAWISPERRLR